MKLPFRKDGAAASANLDDVRRAFYNTYVPEHQSEGTLWWWIQAIYTDPNELVVEDDETGLLYKIPFSSDTKGSVDFGDAAQVRIEYVPDNRDAQKAAATHVAATLAIAAEANGQTCLASWPTRAASRPETTGGAMDPKEVRERLNLPEDASDEQVRDKLAELNTAAGSGGLELKPAETSNEPAAHGGTTPVGTGQPEPSADNAQPDPAPEANAAGEIKVPEGMALVDKGTLEELRVGAAAGLETKRERDTEKRNSLVSAALADGRIPHARKEHWLTALETDLEGSSAALAALEKGLIPVEQRGHSGGGDAPEGDGAEGSLDLETVAGWSAGIFPEVRRMREIDAATAAGNPPPRQRIVADGAYRR